MENIAPKFMVAKCSWQNTFWLLKCIKELHFGEHNPLLKHGTDMAPRRILHIVEMILLEFF